MPTQIIAPTSGSASSSDITLADSETAKISIFDASGGSVIGSAYVEQKASNGTYSIVPGSDLSSAVSGFLIAGPGTFRVVKKSSAAAFGVDRD